jgi:hypothetical protein
MATSCIPSGWTPSWACRVEGSQLSARHALWGVLAVAREPVQKAHWVVALYPDAGEAGGTLRTTTAASRVGVGGVDPERSRAEAGRRARTKVRRYCAANRLNRLGTLTYAGTGCHDPRQARADAGEFFRELREQLDGESLPYLWVPEWHPGGHGLHLHFAVGRYIKRSAIESALPADQDARPDRRHRR